MASVHIWTEEELFQIAFLVAGGWRFDDGAWKKAGESHESTDSYPPIDTDRFEREEAYWFALAAAERGTENK